MKAELGAYGALDLNERNEYYKQAVCVPTTDEAGEINGRRQMLDKLCDMYKPRSILELGCHDGFLTRRLIDKEYCYEVVGVELSEQAIMAARKIRNEEYKGKNLRYLQEDMFEHLKNSRAAYDMVCVSEVIEHFHMDEVFNLLRLAWTRTKEGGTLFLTTPHIDGEFGRSNPDAEHITLFDCAVMESVIDDVLGVPSDVFRFGPMIFATVEK